jgi:hypothetical protein
LFSRVAARKDASQASAWKALDPDAVIPGWVRFGAAEARLRGEPAQESRLTAPPSPARSKPQKSEDKQALFRQFLRWQQQQKPSQDRPTQDSPMAQEKLFEEFLRSRQSR